jgi:hypothetical protein
MRPVKIFLLSSALAVSLYSIPNSIAATQGILDPTSNGSFEVTLTIPDRVQITGLQDINFGTFVSGDFNNDFPICVYSNTPTAQYGVTATGDGAASAFTLTNGTDTIPYRVFWNETAGTTVGELQLTATTKLGNRAGANQQSYTCSTGGDSANLHVSILDANMRSITNGTYTGTLTLLIDPA